MSEDSNICTLCGGVLRFEWVMAFEQCRPHDMRVELHGIDAFKLCPGHGEESPNEWQNGSLDERDTRNSCHASVALQEWDNSQHVAISVGSATMPSTIYLDSAQALSLLAWLLQEHEMLGELASRRIEEDEKP